MKLMQFIKNFWTGNKNVNQDNFLGLNFSLREQAKPYEFNEFELYFIEAMNGERYSSINKLFKKGFKVEKELREKVYEKFWMNFFKMNVNNGVVKREVLEEEKFDNFIKFIVENNIFEIDFIDFIDKTTSHINDSHIERYQLFKNNINKYDEVAEKHNKETIKIDFLKKNKIELKGLKKGLPLSSDFKSSLSIFGDDYVQILYGQTNISNYNTTLTNKNLSLYSMSLSFSKALLFEKQDQLNDGSFSNFKIFRNPLLEIPYLDFLNFNKTEDIRNIKCLSNFANEYRKRGKELGQSMSLIYHDGVNKKEFVSTLFFPYLLKSIIEKGTKPIELFRKLANKSGSISDLVVILFQEYPKELLDGLNKEENVMLCNKLEIVVSNLEKEVKKMTEYSYFKVLQNENEFIAKSLRKDLEKIVDYVHSQDEDIILKRFTSIREREVESTSDFISFAKIKDFPSIIIDRLEYINQKISTLGKYDLDVESKYFIQNSPHQIMKIMDNYLSLEEFTDVSKETIDSILITPIIELDNTLDNIMKNYQEDKIKELSIGKKIARSKV